MLTQEQEQGLRNAFKISQQHLEQVRTERDGLFHLLNTVLGLHVQAILLKEGNERRGWSFTDAATGVEIVQHEDLVMGYEKAIEARRLAEQTPS